MPSPDAFSLSRSWFAWDGRGDAHANNMFMSVANIHPSERAWLGAVFRSVIHPSQELCEDIAPGNMSALSVKQIFLRHNYFTVVGNKIPRS